MKLTLTPKESEEYFYNSLCNSISEMNYHGLHLDYDDDEYKKSREKLTSPCREDVWMEMLRDGYKLMLVDDEGDGEYTRSITLEDVHNKVQLTPLEHLTNMINENDDCETGDVIIQTVFYGDIIFG